MKRPMYLNRDKFRIAVYSGRRIEIGIAVFESIVFILIIRWVISQLT